MVLRKEPVQGLLPMAHERAQRRFRAMLDAYERCGTWNTKEARLYVAAERTVDALLNEARWEESKADLDALIAADIETDPSVRWHYELDR